MGRQWRPRLLLKGAGARRATEVWQCRSDGYFCAAVRLQAKHPSGFACHPLSKEGSWLSLWESCHEVTERADMASPCVGKLSPKVTDEGSRSALQQVRRRSPHPPPCGGPPSPSRGRHSQTPVMPAAGHPLSKVYIKTKTLAPDTEI